MASKGEAIFCRIAVKNKLLTVEQCKECERIRTEKGGEKSLVQIFVEKGYISNKMADAIFRAEERIKKRIEKQKPKPTAEKEKSAEEYTYELLDSETAYQLTPAETGDTIHPDVIKEGDTDTALPPKIIGKDTFYENLTEEQRREIENLNLPVEIKKSDSVVYNINVQQFGDKDKNLPVSADPSAMTLHRGELTESQLLALIKGERITLPTPAAQVPAPVQHLMTGQHTLMAALQKNTLLTMLAIGVLVIMFGLGTFALVSSLSKQKEPPGPVIVTQPRIENIEEKSLIDLHDLYDSKSPSLRMQVIQEFARRAREQQEYNAVIVLVEALGDGSAKVREEARWGLLDLKKKPENIGLVRAAWGNLSEAYDETTAAPELKRTYLSLLAALDYERILQILSKALKDPDPGVRSDAVQYLQKIDDPNAIDIMQIAVADSDPAIVQTALNHLWANRSAYPGKSIFMNLLTGTDLKTGALESVVAFLIGKKVDAYRQQYAELVKAHADVGVKIAAVKALQAFGPVADGIIYTPFDTALHALPKHADFRNAVLEACKIIRGENSDDILGKIMVGDADPKLRQAARDFLVNHGTPKGREFVKNWDRDQYEALVNAKVAETKAALALGDAKNWTKAFPALDKISKDTNVKLIDDALKKLDYTRESFKKKYVAFRQTAKHIQKSNGEWVDPWPEWQKTLAEVQKKREANLYSDAVIELNKFDRKVLDELPDMKRAFDDTQKDLEQAALTAIVEDKKTVRDMITKKNFPGARSHIDLMKQRYRNEVFSWAGRNIGYVEAEWDTAEIIERGKVFVIEDNTPFEEARQIVRQSISGKDIRDFGSYSITRPSGVKGILISFTLNPGQTHSLPLGFNLRGARNIKGHGALQLSIAGPRGTRVSVSMTGGSGTSYSAVKTLGTIHGSMAFRFAEFQARGGVMNKVSDETTINALTIMIVVRNGGTTKKTQRVSLNNVAFVP